MGTHRPQVSFQVQAEVQDIICFQDLLETTTFIMSRYWLGSFLVLALVVCTLAAEDEDDLRQLAKRSSAKERFEMIMRKKAAERARAQARAKAAAMKKAQEEEEAARLAEENKRRQEKHAREQLEKARRRG